MSRSIGAVLAGFLAVVILSLGTDAAMHAAGVFPPLGQPVADALLLLATAYRIVYGVAGGYITARLAPNRHMRHALALGVAYRHRDAVLLGGRQTCQRAIARKAGTITEVICGPHERRTHHFS